MATATTARRSAGERREQIIEAATAEFAVTGLHGTSTDAIARRVGVSQPYLFRLFGTKKELYLATVERCFTETLDTFRTASEGMRGEDALVAIGRAYLELLGNRARLTAQMQAYASCDDPDVREVVRRGYGALAAFVEEVSGASPKRVSDFFAKGMLLNVIAAMDLRSCRAAWAKRLLEGCKQDSPVFENDGSTSKEENHD